MIRMLGVLILLTTAEAAATPPPPPPDAETNQTRESDQAAGLEDMQEPSTPADTGSASRDDRQAPDASALPFNQTKVAHWIRTRMETHRLQERIKARGGGPAEFFPRRDELVQDMGWTVAGFTATEKRIRKTRMAIEMSREDHSDYFPDEIEYMQRQVAETEADWPSVEPYLDDLQHLTDWVAGNVAEPPEVARP